MLTEECITEWKTTILQIFISSMNSHMNSPCHPIGKRPYHIYAFHSSNRHTRLCSIYQLDRTGSWQEHQQ